MDENTAPDGDASGGWFSRRVRRDLRKGHSENKFNYLRSAYFAKKLSVLCVKPLRRKRQNPIEIMLSKLTWPSQLVKVLLLILTYPSQLVKVLLSKFT